MRLEQLKRLGPPTIRLSLPSRHAGFHLLSLFPDVQRNVNRSPTVEAIDSHKLQSLRTAVRIIPATLVPSNINDHLRVLTFPLQSPSFSAPCYDRPLHSLCCCSWPLFYCSFPSYRRPWSRASRSRLLTVSILACLDIVGKHAVALRLAILQVVRFYSLRPFQKYSIEYQVGTTEPIQCTALHRPRV